MWSVRISIVHVWRIRNTGTHSLQSTLWTRRVSILLIISLYHTCEDDTSIVFLVGLKEEALFWVSLLKLHEHWELFNEYWYLFFTDIIKELEKNSKVIKDVSHSQELLKKNLRYNCKEIIMYSSTSNEMYISSWILFPIKRFLCGKSK